MSCNADILVVLPHSSRFNLKNPDSIDTVAWMGWRYSELSHRIRVLANHTSPAIDRPRIMYAPEYHAHRKNWQRFVLSAVSRQEVPRVIEVHKDITLADQLKQQYPQAHVVLMFHNTIDAQLNWLKKRRRIQRLARLDGIIFVSHHCADVFRIAYPQFAQKAFVVHNAIEIDHWHQAYDAPRNKCIHFAGRAVVDKGIVPLIEALRLVLAEDTAWRAHLFTHQWKNADREITQLYETHVPCARLEWQVDADRDAVRSSLQQAAIAVVPTLSDEPFGLATLEAHVAGAALISSGTGGLREVSNEHALYVDPVSPDTLKEALQHLMHDDCARLDLAARGQTQALERFQPQTVIHQLDSLRRRWLASR